MIYIKIIIYIDKLFCTYTVQIAEVSSTFNDCMKYDSTSADHHL